MRKRYKVNKKRLTVFLILIISIVVLIGLNIKENLNSISTAIDEKNAGSTMIIDEKEKLGLANNNTNSIGNERYIYISDLEYITANNWSYNGWSGHSIQKDKNPEGGTIKLNVDGKPKIYLKGMGIHATGQVTYDISSYSNKYTRFIAKVGVDASRTTSSSLWIRISTSTDGENWRELQKTSLLTYGSNGVDVDVEIKGATYLRIYVDANGGNTADHGVIANAKIVTEDYNEETEGLVGYDKIHKIEYYDNILKEHNAEYNMNNNYRLILEREFVRKIGYDEIQAVASIYPESKATLDWILDESNPSVLEQCIQVGELREGLSFFNVISSLYNIYKEELKTENGYVYQKMIISIAAGYTTDAVASPLSFSLMTPTYDVQERFRLMKQLFDTNQFERPSEFKELPVELMRSVMNDAVRNDELLWLNAYSQTKGANKLNCHAYMSYVSPNYNRDIFFAEENKSKYSNKYNLETYNVPYGDGRTQRYWMALEAGGICWNISRMAQSVCRVNGIPSYGAYQPGHEPYFIYSTKNGKGIWQINYNIGGWGICSTTWGGTGRYRLPLDWANKYFTDQAVGGSKGGTSSGYIVLAQANLNDYANYQKSVGYNLLANSYTDEQSKLEAYNKALEVQKLNLDTYDSMINLYKAMGEAATSEDWYQLAKKVIDAYTYYPPASYDLIQVIKPHITNVDKRFEIEQQLQSSLEQASRATSKESIQDVAVREIASALLGKPKAELATFSFDGANAGKIVLDKSYDEYDFVLYYSLDGGVTYSEGTQNHIIPLTKEEIVSITAKNDIKIKMSGTDQVYTIDILDNPMAVEVYGNDLENRVVGANLDMEWRYAGVEEWTSYEEESPVLTGDVTVSVRLKATGRKVSGAIKTFTFTKDNQPENRKYVQVSHVHIKEAGSQVNSATNAIDGNYNTYWRSGSDNRYIVFEFDKPIYLSAVEFVPGPGSGTQSGRIYSGTIINEDNKTQYFRSGPLYYTSDDKTIAQAIKDSQMVTTSFTNPVQRIRITFSATDYATARAINFYQDLTKVPGPTAGVAYSTQEPTNGNVVARLINKSSENVEITNNNGSDTYTFTENGEFKFEFIDRETNKRGSAIARVNWIDREAPTATIEYSTRTSTNGAVIATLKPSEDITVTSIDKYRLDANGNIIDAGGNILSDLSVDDEGNVKDKGGYIMGNVNPFLHRFNVNGSYTFEFVDKAGNKGSATATVDWIDQTAPRATVFYDIMKKTNQNVTARLEFDKENVTITNNNGKNSYTFTENGEFTFYFVDEAGNQSSEKVVVTWIDKEPPTADVEYSTTEKTENPVIAKLVNPSKEITIINNDGKDSYTFTENGIFKFIIEDQLGNRNEILAEVDWIGKEPPIEEDKEDEKEEDKEDNKITSDVYEIQDNIIRKIPINLEASKFMKNIQAKKDIVIKDKKGNVVSEKTKIGTGMKAHIGENAYTIVVTADIDGNGILTITDLAKMCLHYIEEEILKNEYFEAADIDGNGKITIKDLAKIQLLLIE